MFKAQETLSTKWDAPHQVQPSRSGVHYPNSKGVPGVRNKRDPGTQEKLEGGGTVGERTT